MIKKLKQFNQKEYFCFVVAHLFKLTIFNFSTKIFIFSKSSLTVSFVAALSRVIDCSFIFSVNFMIKVAISIIPYLVAIIVAVSMFKASGILEFAKQKNIR